MRRQKDFARCWCAKYFDAVQTFNFLHQIDSRQICFVCNQCSLSEWLISWLSHQGLTNASLKWLIKGRVISTGSLLRTIDKESRASRVECGIFWVWGAHSLPLLTWECWELDRVETDTPILALRWTWFWEGGLIFFLKEAADSKDWMRRMDAVFGC